MIIDFSKLESPDIYRTMIQCVIPRPIAWVVSDNGNGSHNLAPFSYFNGVSSRPPILSIAIGKKRDGELKDTWKNIAEREVFTVNIPSVDHVEMVSDSAASLPHGESEASVHDISLVKENGFDCPRVEKALIALACVRHQIVEVGDTPMGLILGRIKQVYVADELVSNGSESSPQIDPRKLNPLARLGGDHYTELGRIITVKRDH